MPASFHQLFTFYHESQAKKENLPYQKLLEFSKTESISSKLSKTTNYFILKRPPLRYLVSKTMKNHIKNHI